MAAICRHCSTPYRSDSGVDGFCCAGCREVHALICQEGLGDYYREQDRVATPLKDRAPAVVDAARFQEAQSKIEAMSDPAQARFPVSGMSCMGCVWLVGRLAQRQPGCSQARVSLTEQSVELTWSPKAQFDLSALAEELRRFGYSLEARPKSPGRAFGLSALALRSTLSLVFTGNALLLAAYSEWVRASSLVDLLSLACLCFTVLLGALPFFQAVLRAAQIRRWHSDTVPSLGILFALLYLGYGTAFKQLPLSWAVSAACLFISALVSARFLANRFSPVPS
jgi:Cu2+-exporting ATPase